MQLHATPHDPHLLSPISQIQKGLRPRRSVRTAMAHEINMFAIVQKDQLGLDKAVEECKFRMSRYSVTPNMMIIPPQECLRLPQPLSAAHVQRPSYALFALRSSAST